jgi:hypothetical protein
MDAGVAACLRLSETGDPTTLSALLKELDTVRGDQQPAAIGAAGEAPDQIVIG